MLKKVVLKEISPSMANAMIALAGNEPIYCGDYRLSSDARKELMREILNGEYIISRCFVNKKGYTQIIVRLTKKDDEEN